MNEIAKTLAAAVVFRTRIRCDEWIVAFWGYVARKDTM
jgi:hypothetical protein